METANGAKNSSRLMRVAPRDIRFTQDTIPAYFDPPHAGDRLDKAVEMIMSQSLSVDDFPHMRVLLVKDQLWTLNNRRLWVFRKAGAAEVSVRLQGRFDDASNPFLGSYMYKLMSPREFFPRVRGECRLDFDHPSEWRDAHTDMGVARPSEVPLKVPAKGSPRSQSMVQRRESVHKRAQVGGSTSLNKGGPPCTSINKAQGVKLMTPLSQWKKKVTSIKNLDGYMFITFVNALKVTFFVLIFWIVSSFVLCRPSN